MNQPGPPDGDSGPVALPFNLRQWIADRIDTFNPPVSNRVVWQERDHIFMVIRGPNARTDFHIDPYDEIFMQLEGAIRVDLIEDGERVTRWVREGELMLVPANMAHSPQRPPGSWGLVIERVRNPGDLDALVWYCEVCDAEHHRVEFELRDIETELASALSRYNETPAVRICPNGHHNRIPAEFDEVPPASP